MDMRTGDLYPSLDAAQEVSAMTKTYLGDGVYAEAYDHALGVILTTENGIETTNTIYLNPQVLDALGQFVREWIEERNRSKPDQEITR